eukprot:3958632-Prymnesium_polylepis.1
MHEKLVHHTVTHSTGRRAESRNLQCPSSAHYNVCHDGCGCGDRSRFTCQRATPPAGAQLGAHSRVRTPHMYGRGSRSRRRSRAG